MHLFTQSTTQSPGFQPDLLTILMFGALAVMIFFMFRSSKKRKAEQAEAALKMVPGVQVMTNFGLFGELREVDDEKNEAFIEIAPGTVVRVHRQTLARVVEDEPVIPDTAESIDGAPERHDDDQPGRP